MKARVVLAVLYLTGAAWSAAQAQIGVPNTPLLQPGKPLPAPFGAEPHPFNDSHPSQPWDRFHVGAFGLVIREFTVPPRTHVLPMEVPQPGSLPPKIERREVILPGYRVTETTTGFIVREHWTVRRIGNAYYWTRRPTYFKSKQQFGGPGQR